MPQQPSRPNASTPWPFSHRQLARLMLLRARAIAEGWNTQHLMQRALRRWLRRHWKEVN